MLVGQIVDAINIPLIAIVSDHLTFRIGKRRFWYIIGAVFAGVGAAMVF